MSVFGRLNRYTLGVTTRQKWLHTTRTLYKTEVTAGRKTHRKRVLPVVPGTLQQS
jgi:hypothetical protein